MGNYNPYAPYILGEEWVPIRDEQTVFTPQTNTAEYGHGFHLDTARTLQEARVYIDEIPSNLGSSALIAAVYPANLEAASGPIKRVVIPVESAAVTGAVLTTGGLPVTGPGVLLSPVIGGYYLFDSDHAHDMVFLSFNMQECIGLTNKRILAVNLLYAGSRLSADPIPATNACPEIGIQDSTGVFNAVPYSNGEDMATGPTGFGGQQAIIRLRFGATNPFGTTGLCWQYPVDLGRFDASSASPMYVTFKAGTDFSSQANVSIFLYYAALEVIYCEEQRLVYGIGLNQAAALGNDRPDWGANVITLRSVPSGALLPTLQPGDYSVVVAGVDEGSRFTPYSAPLSIGAQRELYALPTHPGIQVDIPYPPEDYLDHQFAELVTHVLPQISLHATGGTLTEPHVYGRQGKAPVYGSVSAIQDIYDDIPPVGGVAYSYPQVRFYARKFGTTTVPLKLDSTAIPASSALITPAEHDQLPEIIDGWKECTLRFPTPPSMGAVAGNPDWRFTSVGELAGSQWQVLSACAPAVSGVPGSLATLVTPVHRLGTATYQPPAGDTVELTWLSPCATGAVVDPACDAVLIFSQDPVTVTGVSISQATQTVTGVALNCGGLPCCVVTGIGYNRVTWGLPVNTGIADDDFARTVAAGGLGTASDGKTWTTSGTAGDFSVDPTNGATIVISATGSDRLAWVDVGGPDQRNTVAARVNEAAESGTLREGVTGRLTDANNYYRAEVQYTSADAANLVLTKRVAGVETILQTVVLGSLRPAQTTPRMISIEVDGINLRAKAWDSDQVEPWWQILTTDTALATGNNGGLYARDDTGAATSTWYFTSFTGRPPAHAFGGLELQRFDSQVGTFETIMLASSPAVTGFSDYEARVGVDSVYRIRTVNIYNFAGPWSTQVTGAPAEPGVTGNGTCDLTQGPLIFTSNADQTGQRNCAYMMLWDQDPPTEGFTLPEAQRVSYLELYDRDGRVAFHGTERGLEAFSRQLLIQAAALDPAVMANVRTLRDLAWADLPYVCVRDDSGNRWYANVRVPDVMIRDSRSKHLATVEVIETSRIPCVVDPA